MKNGFICGNCGRPVSFSAPGTHHRNHCPYCLASIHIDNLPGDRKSTCGGKMLVIGKFLKEDGEEVLVHKCEKCGITKNNRIAGDDSFKLVEKLPIIDKSS
jgi:ribosome biogenesis GTPase / thiamine phosphate phosphatase